MAAVSITLGPEVTYVNKMADDLTFGGHVRSTNIANDLISGDIVAPNLNLTYDI